MDGGESKGGTEGSLDEQHEDSIQDCEGVNWLRSKSVVPFSSKNGRALLSNGGLNQQAISTLDQETPAQTLNMITLKEVSSIEVARAIKSLTNNKGP